MLLRSYRHLRPGQDDNFSIFASDTIVSLWERLDRDDRRHGRGHRLGVHGRGRHRDYEHHAGGGDRAHARNRHSQIAGRAPPATSSISTWWNLPCWPAREGWQEWRWHGAWRLLVRSLTSVPMALPWSSILIGVGLSATVGLFFGIYPARQAARLDPIEALRVER